MQTKSLKKKTNFIFVFPILTIFWSNVRLQKVEPDLIENLKILKTCLILSLYCMFLVQSFII